MYENIWKHRTIWNTYEDRLNTCEFIGRSRKTCENVGKHWKPFETYKKTYGTMEHI